MKIMYYVKLPDNSFVKLEDETHSPDFINENIETLRETYNTGKVMAVITEENKHEQL